MHTNYLIPHMVDGLWGYKDIYGKLVIRPEWVKAEPFVGSFAKVFDGNRFGLIDTSGVVILDLKYDKIVLREDLAGYEFHLNRKIGFISFDRRFFLMPQFSYLGPLAEGFIPAAKDGLYGFLNGRFETAHTFMYRLTEPFRHGIARVTTMEGKTVLIDRKWKTVESPRYLYPDKEEFDRFVSGTDFEFLNFYKSLPNGVGVYCRNNESYFTAISKNNEYMMATYYDSIEYLSPDYVRVGIFVYTFDVYDGYDYYGVFDLKGNQILPPVFERVEYIGNNCFLVYINGKWGIINNRLEVLIEPVLANEPDVSNGLIELKDETYMLIKTGYLEMPKIGNTKTDAVTNIPRHAVIDGFDAYNVQKGDSLWNKCKNLLDCITKYWICSDSDARDKPRKNNSFIKAPEYYKTVSHGTLPAEDMTKKFIVNIEVDPLHYRDFDCTNPNEGNNGGTFPMEELNDPESWKLSAINKSEDDDMNQYRDNRELDLLINRVVYKNDYNLEVEDDPIPDAGNDNAPLGFGIFDNDDDDDDDFEERLSAEEEAEFLESLQKENSGQEEKEEEEGEEEEPHLDYTLGGFVVDKNGNPVFASNKSSIYYWGEGAYTTTDSTVNEGEAKTILNARLEPLDPEIHPCANDEYKVEGYRRVVCRGRFGFIDKNGDLAVEPAFISLSQFMKKKALGITATSTIIMNTELEYKELPLKLVNFHSWDGTMAAGCIPTPEGRKWGVFDENGNILIPFEYDFIRHAGEMSFIVKINGKFGVINAKREMLVEPHYTTYEMTETPLLALKHPGGWYHLFNVRTQRLITSYEGEGCQKPLRPTRITVLKNGLLFLETTTITGYLDLSSPVNTRLITE